MRRPSLRAVVFGAALLLTVVAVILLRTSDAARSAREAEARRASARVEAGAATSSSTLPAVTVDALTVAHTEARTVVDVSGILEPVRHVVIGAEVAGRVVSIAVDEHTTVTAGEVLVRLDPALPRAAVERGRAALLRARASEKLAAAEVARQRELSTRGVASTAELDRAESVDKSAAAQVAEARAALLDAETRLAKTEIRAPFAGIVHALDLEPGAYLNPGEPVAELADISEVEIEVGLSDREILAVKDGDPVRVSVEAYSGRWFEGRVVNPGRTVDSRTSKYPVAVLVPNAEEALLPGMLGTVRFEIGDGRPAFWVPRRSVFSEFDLEYLYVLEAASADDPRDVRAERRRVTTRAVAFRPEWREVTSGLEGGERIATSDVRGLRDGMRVALRDTGPPAARTATAPTGAQSSEPASATDATVEEPPS